MTGEPDAPAESIDDGEQPCSIADADPEALALNREVTELAQSTELTRFDRQAPTQLPQPDRAQSVKDLPKVTSGSFPRLLR